MLVVQVALTFKRQVKGSETPSVSYSAAGKNALRAARWLGTGTKASEAEAKEGCRERRSSIGGPCFSN